MSNAKIVSIMDAEMRGAAAKFENELVALRAALGAQLQPLEQIVEQLEQRVSKLEAGLSPEASA
jgi:exonuclease VII small subunit